MKQTNRRSNGFTLLELLTVIAIIAVLAGLLFPTIKNALLRAEVAKAQQAVNGLATAFRAYHTEYGRWPVGTPGPINVTTPLVGILKGETNPLWNGTFGGVDYYGNPRGIVFLEFKASDLYVPALNTTNFADAWGRVYHCSFDTDYDNLVQNPFLPVAPPANLVSAGFLVWSDGPDGLEDQNGDVPPSALNKDNVKSW